MALTPLQQLRLLVQDNTPGLYFLSDDEMSFLIQKNSCNVNRASLEAARIILMNLSMRGDSTVDVLSIRGSAAAEQYRKALVLYIKSPELNPLLQEAGMYAGGISLSDMQANVSNPDNNYVKVPTEYIYPTASYPSSYFVV